MSNETSLLIYLTLAVINVLTGVVFISIGHAKNYFTQQKAVLPDKTVLL